MANNTNMKLRIKINHDLQNGMLKKDIALKHSISRRMVTYYTKKTIKTLDGKLLEFLYSNEVENYSKSFHY